MQLAYNVAFLTFFGMIALAGMISSLRFTVHNRPRPER
jgi:hypothetical protein